MGPAAVHKRPSLTTCLFDLDGTLLDVHMPSFLEAYFPLLAPHFGAESDVTAFKSLLISAVRQMMHNRNEQRRLSQVFLDAFTPHVDMTEIAVLNTLRRFHENEFEELRPLTRPFPEARPMLEKALALGYRLALATNPVFFREAIDARIRWAGLEDIPFRFVSTAENMHFSKPHPEYFNEILRRVDANPMESVMIGNDPAKDLPAGKVGITTYYIPAEGELRNLEAADYTGSLTELSLWLEETRGAP